MGRPAIVRGLYPSFLFYTVKFFQNLSAAGASGVLFYFIIHLNQAGYQTPWMFYLLQGAALATIVTNLLTSIVACISSPSPILNTLLTAILVAAWAVGTGLFINAYKDSVTRQCTAQYWGSDGPGVLICNLYRVLFICALVATAMTVIVLVLDARAWSKYRRASRHGYVGAGMMARGMGSNTAYVPVSGGMQQHPALHSASDHKGGAAVPYSPNLPYDPEGAYQGHGYGR